MTCNNLIYNRTKRILEWAPSGTHRDTNRIAYIPFVCRAVPRTLFYILNAFVPFMRKHSWRAKVVEKKEIQNERHSLQARDGVGKPLPRVGIKTRSRAAALRSERTAGAAKGCTFECVHWKREVTERERTRSAVERTGGKQTHIMKNVSGCRRGGGI